MTTITQKKFDALVNTDARKVHNQYLRMGAFWPLSVCRSEVKKKLSKQYKVS